MVPYGPPRQVVVIDTETTGFGHTARPPREDGIVQVGLAYKDSTGRVKVWTALCNPGQAFLRPGWADAALEVSKLSREKVLAAPAATAVAVNLRAKLAGIQSEVGIPVELRAYNRDFDQPFLSGPPWSVPPSIWGPCIMLDTTRKLDGPDARWVGLNMAMIRLNLEWPGPPHDAGVDAHAALLVLEKISQADSR